MINISVVIPTCNRRDRVLSLLRSLLLSSHPIQEVLIVDSSDEPLEEVDLLPFASLAPRLLKSRKSVCIQRNIGIRHATHDWIFLCDDDVEVPGTYLQRLAEHIGQHAEAGAISGLFRERDPVSQKWVDQYPVESLFALYFRFLFQLGMWGEIRCCRGPFVSAIKQFYNNRGNHISRAGWPVITDFSGPFFRTPVYTLGAALVRKEWLLRSPFDETLDSHGMGDNYGVAIGFPSGGIHIVADAWVLHHKSPDNRAPAAEAYMKRLLALDKFIRTRIELEEVSHRRFLVSLVGGALFHLLSGELHIAWVSLQTLVALVCRPELRSDDTLPSTSHGPDSRDS